MTSVELIDLVNIRTDGGTQMRVELDEETIADYRQKFDAGEQFPPLIVFHDESTYWLADGFHRLFAARDQGFEAIECDVRSGTKRDAILFAVGANAAHGKARTNADKRRAVETLLGDTEWGGQPLNWIAKKCAVSVGLVHKLKEELPSFHREKIDATPRVVTRNGTTYEQNTANIGGGGMRTLASEIGVDEPEKPTKEYFNADTGEVIENLGTTTTKTQKADRTPPAAVAQLEKWEAVHPSLAAVINELEGFASKPAYQLSTIELRRIVETLRHELAAAL